MIPGIQRNNTVRKNFLHDILRASNMHGRQKTDEKERERKQRNKE